MNRENARALQRRDVMRTGADERGRW